MNADEFSLSEKAARQDQLPLLEPKFQPPRLHTALIGRERLLAKLDAVHERRLTLLCAPAGFGKTTLMSQWMEREQSRGRALPVAWVALEKGDNDLLRFWRYVLTACQAFQAEVGQAALARIAADFPPFEMPSLEMLLTLLLNDITRLTKSVVLVLEDYHLITELHIHETLLFFLSHLPSQMHVVLLTRSEPPLPLARWRARGELCEIQATDLRFSREEMASFLEQTLAIIPASLPAAAFSQVETRLEGWAAGLRLLALAFQGAGQQQGVEQVLAAFAGEQRSLQEYFVSEVLAVQPGPWQDFLLRTSLLTRLNGSLCDAVIERRESTRVLEEIERAGLFLEALDRSGGWYRYHALFAEAMQVEARRRLGEEVLRDLSRRASQWYEQQEMQVEAVEAAFQAQDVERAAALIEAILGNIKHIILGPQVFQETNGFHTLRRWLEQLPPEALRRRPLLSLGYASALLFVFVVDQQPPSEISTIKSEEHYSSYAAFLLKIEDALQTAAEEFRAAGDLSRLGGVLTFRALISREQGKMGEAITYATQGLACLPENDQEWRNMGLNVIGMGKLVDGQLEEAQQIFLELYALCEKLGNRAILRANGALLNIVVYEQGKLHQSAAFFRQMLAEAREENDYDDIAHASLLLAWLAYEWNELHDAEERALETLDLGKRIGNEEFQVQAALILARIEYNRGEIGRAQQRCTDLLARLPAISPLRTRLSREIQLVRTRFALATGNFAAVERWRASNSPDPELPLSLCVREELLTARWLVVRGRAAEALETLADLLEDAGKAGRMRSALEIQSVLLQALHACGESQQAGQMFRELLAGAQAEGYQRLFLDEGEIMLTFLRVSIPHLHERALVTYAQTLLQAAVPREPQGDLSAPAYTLLAEPLSPQEQRVLRLLISGQSNPEIARDLVVSVNTVKVHIKSIYRKLNVASRLEASEAARHLGFS